jgi:hypothetical protein
MRNMWQSNSYAAVCELCGDIVPAGQGTLFAKKGGAISHKRDGDPKWRVQHKKTSQCKPTEATHDK